MASEDKSKADESEGTSPRPPSNPAHTRTPLLPLPSGPSTLCFNKEDFMKSTFNVDQFVMECRRRVPLDTLRDDLQVYMEVLKSAMIELINKDYADFVNLSTNLVGMDKAIGNLVTPLDALKDEVLSVRSAMDKAIAEVEEKINKRRQCREKKAALQRLMNIVQSVEKMEKLLGIRENENNPQQSYELNGQLIERVATEFNRLQFYVSKSHGMPLVEEIKPRIATITTTLQYSLEGSFKEGLENGNMEILRQCLRTYATIDKMRDAENRFRIHEVQPYMQEIITEQFIHANIHGLKGMYNKVLEFIPSHCKTLKEVTLGSGSQDGEVIRGYDFLVNAVWPEIVQNIEARTPSIFAPGNPSLFHTNYTISMQFLDEFERNCGSQASVKRLRAHPSFNVFMTKWSLPVYFQIRLQEIAGLFEAALMSPFNNAENAKDFKLQSSEILWICIQKCWHDDIFLMALTHRFLKLTLQLLARYSSWIAQVVKEELVEGEENETAIKPPVPSAGDHPPAEPITPRPPPITIRQIVCLIADAQFIAYQIPALYEQVIKPKLSGLGLKDDSDSSLKESMKDCQENITSQLPNLGSYIVDSITKQCAVHLKLVNDIPRLYRRTNRDVPSKASTYLTSLLKPLHHFLEENSDILPDNYRKEWVLEVLQNIGQQYHTVTNDVLTSVKKMEDSLRRLKRSKTTPNFGSSQGMSDDDKIRYQFVFDVAEFGKQIDDLKLSREDVGTYQPLYDLVESAKAGSSSGVMAES